MPRQRLLIGVRQADLAGGGGGLLFLEPQRAAAQAQMAAPDRDRPGGDDDHLLAAPSAARDVVDQRVEPGAADLAVLADQQRRADLQDDPARRDERRGRGAWYRPPLVGRRADGAAAVRPSRRAPSGRSSGCGVCSRDIKILPLLRRPQSGRLEGRTGLHPASTSASGASARAASIAAKSAPSTGAIPAPLTPDSGSTVRAGPRRAGERAAFPRDIGGIDRVDLVEADDFRLVGQPVAVIGELAADRPIGADDVLLGPVDQVEDHGAALDMPQEAGAEPGAVAGALDEPGQVGEHEFRIVAEPHDPELRDARW